MEASGAEWTHIRPGLLAAGALNWAEQVRTSAAVRAPYPRAGSALVHEADVAEVAVAALLTDDHLWAAHTITGPEKVSQAAQVRAIGEAIGKEVRFVELTPEQARKEWYDPERGRVRRGHRLAARPVRLVGSAAPRTPARRRTRSARVGGEEALPGTGDFERVVGRPPRTFAQWAADHAEDFR